MPVCKLQGRLAEGMFPNELVVVLTDDQGREQAVIISADEVQRVKGDGVIKVQVIDRKQGFSLVRLPGELITAGRVLSIRDDQLEAVG